MNKQSVLVLMVLLPFSAIVLAQRPGDPPHPGPEEKRLGYYVGKWRSEADMKPSVFGPGGKETGNINCEWYAGGFHVVCHADFGGAMGAEKALAILSYNREEKVYEWYRISSWGETGSAKGAVEGDTWTWHGEWKVKGKGVPWRATYKFEAPPDRATIQFEVQGDDGKWNAVMEEKTTRVK